MLLFSNVRPMTWEEINKGETPYQDVIVVAWGTNFDRIDHRIPPIDTAAKALQNGGAALIASNEPADLQALAPQSADFGITGERANRREGPGPTALVDGHLSETPLRTLVLSPLPAAAQPGQRLTTLSPSFFNESGLAGPFQERVARIESPRFATNRLFAVGGVGGSDNPFAFLALADQNVFSNGLLLRPDADNWRFALNAVRFLQSGGGRKRTRCLFLDHGRVVESFDRAVEYLSPPDVPLPLPPWREVQKIIAERTDQVADKLQENDSLQKTLLGKRPERSFARIAEVLAIAAAVWAVWYLLRMVWKARQRREPTVLPPPPDSGRAADTVIARRGDELIRRDNLYELARTEVREVFRAAGAEGVAVAGLPPLAFPQGPRDRLARSIRELWPIGFGDVPVRVTVDRWRELDARLGEVRRAAAAGVWRFAAGSGSV